MEEGTGGRQAEATTLSRGYTFLGSSVRRTLLLARSFQLLVCFPTPRFGKAVFLEREAARNVKDLRHFADAQRWQDLF